jgi:lipopolysaccharide exporter
LNSKFDFFLIGALIGNRALGYYTVGDNLAVMPTREVTNPITATLFPAFSALSAEPGRLASAYQRSQSLVTAIALPAGFGTALIADPLVRLLMGTKWLPAVLLIQVLSSVFALQTLGSLSQPLAMATGNTQLLFRRDLQGFIMRVPAIAVGIALGGLPGVVYARAVTGSVIIWLHMLVVRKVTGLTLLQQIIPNVRALIAVALMSSAVYIVGRAFEHLGRANIVLSSQIICSVLIGASVYAAVNLLAWIWMGRPSGPETELAEMATRLLRFRRSPAR